MKSLRPPAGVTQLDIASRCDPVPGAARTGLDLAPAPQPLVRDFYEHTAAFSMDAWSRTYFPANLALALLVTTISRQVDQLNFPLSPLETAHGLVSEILLLRRADGTVRYTGWFRTLARHQRVLYTGFYMTETAPLAGPCVKVVFPMPRGNATVVLRPELGADGSLILDSTAHGFGDAGFYRIQACGKETVRIWHVRTLRERFHVYLGERGVLRCDHSVRFLGMFQTGRNVTSKREWRRALKRPWANADWSNRNRTLHGFIKLRFARISAYGTTGSERP